MAEKLAAAWSAQDVATDDQARELTHGLHAYPARVHPLVARTLVIHCSQPGQLVLDPFVGSGTTLVEAMVAGRRALGSDINPLAARLAWLKTLRLDEAALRQLQRTARAVAERAQALLRQGPPPEAPSPQLALLRRWCAPHVAREVGALLDAVEAHPLAGAPAQAHRLRQVMQLAISSLLVKVSRRRSDTADETVDKALPRGRTMTLFRDRAEATVNALAALAKAPAGGYARVVTADARRLPIASRSAHLILTSPPYVGTYDYAALQGLRAQLFGWTPELDRAQGLEVGSRTQGSFAAWRSAFGVALFEMSRVLHPDGMILLILGDSVAEGRLVRAEEWMADVASTAGLQLRAAASQERPDTFPTQPPAAPRGHIPSPPRREHIIALTPRPRPTHAPPPSVRPRPETQG